MDYNTQTDISTPLFDINKVAFRKYLPVSEMERDWGFIIHDIGHTVIPPDSIYPSQGHPGSHMFSWENGRILHEYQFVLITEGIGIFENKSLGEIKVNAGDGFLLFPGEWHRYKPLKETGWTEYWIGFSGQIPDIVMKDVFFNKQQAMIPQCANLLVKNLLHSLFHLITEEPFGYQRNASGVCLQLIAELCNIHKGSGTAKQASSIISKAKYLMYQKISEAIDFHVFCANHGISYSKFRSDFKQQTGHAPLEYFLLMKIEKAKDLLSNTELRSKQIAFQLGFGSDHYFSRVFRKKTGMTPQRFRNEKRRMTT